MSKGWDNTTLKKLKTLVSKGLSTSEIGRRLGMSKNAVVGKLNRLGWNAKAGTIKLVTPQGKSPAASKTKTLSRGAVKKPAVKTPVKKTTTTKSATVAGVKKTDTKSAPKATVAAKETKVSSKSSAKNLAIHQRIIQHSLEMANLKPNQCRWPIGDPDSENFHFCGKTVFSGKPYCYEHCRLAYQFTPPKKKQ